MLSLAVRLALFGSLHTTPEKNASMIYQLAKGVSIKGVSIYVIVICAINFIWSSRNVG
jgi:hypothetical protein